MPGPLARALATALAASVATACARENPAFDPIGDESDSTGAGATTAAPGPPPTTTAGTTTTGTTTTGTTTTGTTTSTATTGLTGDSSGTGSSSTGVGESGSGGEPKSETAFASIAACVLRTAGMAVFTGPAFCAGVANAFADVGADLMIIDGAVMNNGGENRPAEIYLRIPVPALPDGATITAATLSIHAADTDAVAPGPSGALWRVTPFGDADLDAEATLPKPEVLLVVNELDITPGQASVWQLPAAEIVPGTDLHLGLYPLNILSVLYHSSANAELTPSLTIVYE